MRTRANPLRPGQDTPYGDSMYIRKQSWFAGKRLHRRQGLFVAGEHGPVEEGWGD
jgi:hypothetical protein